VSQIGLNLVAITIFTLVMTSLLGPILHISPVVPAIATFGILGIATLDNFGLQGRGGTLLLDWLASFSAEHRDRVIHHEAGHFLAAYLLNIPVTGYTLSAWEAFRQGQPGRGGVSFDTQALEQELEQGNVSAQFLDRYCKVWMAGIAAETLVYGNAEGGGDDRQKFRLLWAHLRRPEVEGEQKANWSAFQVKSLLQDHWSAYEALVDAMRNRASVEDCSRAIEQHLAMSDSTPA
jgi:IS1 family transposase